jgi:hypothetical protein
MEPEVHFRVHNARCWSLPWDGLIQFTPYFFEVNIILHLLLGLPSDILPSSYPTKSLYSFQISINDSCLMKIDQHKVSKVKLSRYTPWRHMGGEEVKLLLILNLGTRWGWVVSVTPRPRFTPRERTPGTHYIGGWVDPKAGLDAGAIRRPRYEDVKLISQ